MKNMCNSKYVFMSSQILIILVKKETSYYWKGILKIY